MLAPIRMNVQFDMWSDGAGLHSDQVSLTLSGAPDEPFRAVLDRAYASTRGHTLLEWWGPAPMPITFGWSESDDLSVFIDGDDELPYGEVDRFFGHVGRSDPPSVHVDTTTGRGGDVLFLDMVALLRGAVEVYGILEAFIAAQKGLVYLRHRDARKAVGRRENSGTIGSLEQLVKAQASWSSSEFRNRFGVTNAEAGQLLRALGYSHDAATDQWSETRPDED